MEEILKVFDLTARDGQMILIGSAAFYIFWCIVDVAIFKPFLRVYEEREALTSGAAASSKGIFDEASLINRRTEEKLQAARVAAMTEKYHALIEAKKNASKRVVDAENEVQEQVRNARWNRETALTATKAQVMSEADVLARAIAERLKQPTTSSASQN